MQQQQHIIGEDDDKNEPCPLSSSETMESKMMHAVKRNKKKSKKDSSGSSNKKHKEKKRKPADITDDDQTGKNKKPGNSRKDGTSSSSSSKKVKKDSNTNEEEEAAKQSQENKEQTTTTTQNVETTTLSISDVMNSCYAQQQAVMQFLEEAIDFCPVVSGTESSEPFSIATSLHSFALSMQEKARHMLEEQEIDVGSQALAMMRKIMEEKVKHCNSIHAMQEGHRQTIGQLENKFEEECKTNSSTLATMVRKWDEMSNKNRDDLQTEKAAAMRKEEENTKLINQCQELGREKKRLEEELKKKDCQIALFQSASQQFASTASSSSQCRCLKQQKLRTDQEIIEKGGLPAPPPCDRCSQ